MKKILVVEDDAITQIFIQSVLGKKYDVVIVSSAQEASEVLRTQSFPPMLLDVGLPGEDGMDYCAKLRADERYKDMMIVFLTGKQQMSDKVLGLSLGADDYLTKPIDPMELLARVESKIRGQERSLKNQDIFFKGLFRMNLGLQKVFIQQDGAEKEIELTSIEFKLLYFFLQHEDETLGRDEILKVIWGDNVHVSDRTVDTHVSALRQKIALSEDFIQSIPKKGYRFSQKSLKKVA